jgi:hypothetical protein
VTEYSGPKPYAVEQGVAAGRDEVWDAVTQPPVLRQWFGWDYVGLDAEIQQIFIDEATLWAPERMGWADGSYLEVTGDDDRSTVRAVRGGDPSADLDCYDAVEEGWRVFLAQLRFLLEERPKGLRRTIHLTGTTTGRQALALAAAGPGQRPAHGRRPAPGGDAVRLDNRVAQVVHRDGHLVLVAGHEPLDSPDAGRMEITVSTFGLDDAAFADLREGWAARWAPTAGEAEVTVAPRS